MAAMRKEGKLSGIPFDLTTEILLRLPARSVIRFRIACKLWRSTTLDPSFVKAHLDRARKVSPPSLLLAPRRDNDFGVFGGDEDDTWTPKQRFWPMRGKNIFFHGSCNGIICISADDDDADNKIFISAEDGDDDTYPHKIVQLLNPATGDSLTLPKTPNFYRAFFGFHPVTKEYKVLAVDAINGEMPEMPGCRVYTIGTDSSWRDIDAILGFEPVQATLFNGVIYSISYEYPIDTYIVSFDLKDESFKRFPYIDFGEDYHLDSTRIVELQGSLCISFQFADERMDVWRLTIDDSGGIDAHGWTLLYSILPWDGMGPITPLLIHKDKILTMSIIHTKYNDISDNGYYFSMACYRYVKKGNFGVNKILYMHRGHYDTHVHVESLVALPNQ